MKKIRFSKKLRQNFKSNLGNIRKIWRLQEGKEEEKEELRSQDESFSVKMENKGCKRGDWDVISGLVLRSLMI